MTQSDATSTGAGFDEQKARLTLAVAALAAMVDRIWWFLVAGGLLTALAALPLDTRRAN